MPSRPPRPLSCRLPVLLLALAPGLAAAEDTAGAVTAGSAFNPQASLILSGHYGNDNQRGQGAGLVAATPGITDGVAFGDEEPSGGNGFALGDSELVLSATVDPYFEGRFIGVFDGDGHAEVEEAWLETRLLPYGLKAKAGRLKSEIGYANAQHPHAWDFDDQNLAYAALVGAEGLSDAGAQLTWLTPAPFYLLVGAEVLQGEDQARLGTTLAADDVATVLAPAAGALPDTRNGPRLLTAFAKVAPDLGDDHALQLGVSLVRARQYQQLQDPDGAPLSGDEFALDGSQTLYGADLVYKYDGTGELGAGDVKVVAEYLRLHTDLDVTGAGASAPLAAGERAQGRQDGYYVQATWGIAPRWQLGLRQDAAGDTNMVEAGGATAALPRSARTTVALGFAPSEFSRLRLQAAKGMIGTAAGDRIELDQLLLTYTLSLGAHGAHRF